MALLNVENLQVSYGLIKAIKGISFHVDEGEIVALIGTNGAGKTTAMHAVAKLLTPDSGKIEFAGTDVTKYPAHKIVRLGMSQVPEGRRIFQELKVKDNLLLGAFSRKDKAEFSGTLEEMYSLFPILKERENQIAGTLSGGEQQRLCLIRCLAVKPKVLLLDESLSGLDDTAAEALLTLVRRALPDTAVLLITHQSGLISRADTVLTLT